MNASIYLSRNVSISANKYKRILFAHTHRGWLGTKCTILYMHRCLLFSVFRVPDWIYMLNVAWLWLCVCTDEWMNECVEQRAASADMTMMMMMRKRWARSKDELTHAHQTRRRRIKTTTSNEGREKKMCCMLLDQHENNIIYFLQFISFGFFSCFGSHCSVCLCHFV